MYRLFLSNYLQIVFVTSLTAYQTLWHAGHWHHILPSLLHVSLFQAVPQICKFFFWRAFFFLFQVFTGQLTLWSIRLKGDGGLLPVPGWQSGGDPEEVQGHHQDGPQPPERRAVCAVWRRPQGATSARFSLWSLRLAELSATGMLVFPQEEVMVLERILLQTIKFDLQVEHPYMFLLRYVKQLKGNFGRMR